MHEGAFRYDAQRYDADLDGPPGPLRQAMLVLTNRGLFAIAVYRFGSWINRKFSTPRQRYPRIVLKLLFVLARQLSIFVAKTEILEQAEIGPGLYLSNQGEIIIGVHSIGKHCTIGPKVTIGLDHRRRKQPVFGDNVTVGANVVVFGEITIGSFCLISDDTVISKTIPDNCVVRGNPARVERRVSRAAGPAQDLSTMQFQ